MSSNRDFCLLCEDICSSHQEICTICGEELVERPQESSQQRTNINSTAINNNSLQQRVSFMLQQGNDMGLVEEWEEAPPEAMDPQMAASKHLPTSKECLDRIPRIKIDSTSAILYEATVEVEYNSDEKTETVSFDATIGEFEPHPPFHIVGELHRCSNIFGKEPLSKIESTPTEKLIVFMERGEITFVEKCKNAKSIGAKAVICSNSQPIWPYIMKDSAERASSDDIPIVMVKRSDGNRIKQVIRQYRNVKVKIEAKKCSSDCIICTEKFQVGDSVMRLPLCSHVFHEECCMSWLTKHNTCPFCRRELPTDNKEYESERRRIGRSHAGSSHSNNGLAEDQWETIFG